MAESQSVSRIRDGNAYTKPHIHGVDTASKCYTYPDCPGDRNVNAILNAVTDEDGDPYTDRHFTRVVHR